MATLASTADLQNYLQNPAINTAAADLALTLATALIQNQTRQHLFYVADDTVVLVGGQRRLFLPERPVIGTPVVTALAPSALYRYDPPDQLTYGIPPGALAASFYSNAPDAMRGVWPLQVEVTYSHGYQTIPDDLRAVCLSVASRAVTNPQGLRGETLGPYAIQYAGGGDILTAGVALTSAEQRLLDRYKARNRSVVLV